METVEPLFEVTRSPAQDNELNKMLDDFEEDCAINYDCYGMINGAAVEKFIDAGDIESAAEEMTTVMTDRDGGEAPDLIYDIAVDRVNGFIHVHREQQPGLKEDEYSMRAGHPDYEYVAINTQTGAHDYVNDPRDGNWTHYMNADEFTYFDGDMTDYYQGMEDPESEGWQPVIRQSDGMGGPGTSGGAGKCPECGQPGPDVLDDEEIWCPYCDFTMYGDDEGFDKALAIAKGGMGESTNNELEELRKLAGL